ncbi:hypothetical protein AA313_de0209546 [Arthrobotrys entomopaga]|nr:hypothetical protein AA313_de0209546 [Arthrobotrys entomopaga]
MAKRARAVSHDIVSGSPVVKIETRSRSRSKQKQQQQQQQQLEQELARLVESQDQSSSSAEEEEDEPQDTGDEEVLQVDDSEADQEPLGDIDLHYEHGSENRDAAIEEPQSSPGYETEGLSQDDPDVLLETLRELDNEAGRVINHFLVKTIKGDKNRLPQELKRVMKRYQSGNTRYINAKEVAGKWGITHGWEVFEPIFRKANLAALTYMIAKDPNEPDAPNYFAHGGWDWDMLLFNGYAGVDDYNNLLFTSAWRTQIYIRGVMDQKANEKDWPDKCLFGLFLDPAAKDKFLSNSSMSFERKLDGKNVDFRGWTSGRSIPEEYKEEMKEYLKVIRRYTDEEPDGNLEVDMEELMVQWPYEDFQTITFPRWLRIAFRSINASEPTIQNVLDVAEECVGHPDALREKIFEMSTDRPSVQPLISASAEPSRRHTLGSYFERKGIPRETSSNYKSALTAFMEERPEKGKASSSGLKPPTSSVASASTRAHSHRDPVRYPHLPSSTPTAAPKPKPTPTFNINQSLREATKLQEKENTKPPEPRRFNQVQQNRTRVAWESDEPESSTSPQRPQQSSQPAVSSRPTAAVPERAEEMEPPTVLEDDEGFQLVSHHTKRGRSHVAEQPSSGDDESDDFSVVQTAGRKKPRHGDTVIRARGHRFEPTTKATVPRSAQPAPRIETPPQDELDEEYEVIGRSDSPEPPAPPQRRPARQRAGRREWGEDDIETLVVAMREIGPKWARIRDAYFEGRWSNVDIKDKARNLKFTYLKWDIQLFLDLLFGSRG